MGLGEAQGISVFPGPCSGMFPNHLPGLAFHVQHVGLALPPRTTITIAILVGPGSSKELLISTNSPRVIIRSSGKAQLSVISTVDPDSLLSVSSCGWNRLWRPLGTFQTRKWRLREGKRLT